MDQYQQYLKWYCSLALAPDVCIYDFVEDPIYIRTWHSPKVDLSTFRFGLMFRVYDWVVELSQVELYALHGAVESDSGTSLLDDNQSSNSPPERLLLLFHPLG